MQALKFTYISAEGGTFPEAIATVGYLLAYPQKSTIVACYYANQAQAEAYADGLTAVNFEADTATLAANGELFANALAYLKTLPEFAGAEEITLADPPAAAPAPADAAAPAPSIDDPAANDLPV